jgi:hypothetical protein
VGRQLEVSTDAICARRRCTGFVVLELAMKAAPNIVGAVLVMMEDLVLRKIRK